MVRVNRHIKRPFQRQSERDGFETVRAASGRKGYAATVEAPSTALIWVKAAHGFSNPSITMEHRQHDE